VSRPSLRDPIAEIAMCLNTANAALPTGLVDEPAQVPFIRMQLHRALDALEQIAARKPTLKLVADGGDLGRAAGHLESPHSRPPVVGGSCEVTA
jgi:hypothetical protein